MSLILFMETDEGLILTGDSRVSSENDENWHKDDAYKVFECSGRIGIAYHGAADIRGETIEKIIVRFINSVDEKYSVFKVATKFQEYIKNQFPTRKTIFYVMGYDDNREIYKFDTLNDIIENESDCVHGSGGDDEIAWNMMKGKFDVHDTVFDAINFINSIYERTMNNNNKVGGAIDMLLISPSSGTKWLYKKVDAKLS